MAFDQLFEALRHPPDALARLRGVPGLYLVGGLLREAWWGRASCDYDLVAADLPAALDAIGAALGHKPFQLSERFGSYRLALDDCYIDIGPLDPEGLEADMARRDYTINTLCVPVARLGPELQPGDIASRPQAFADMEAGVLRMVARGNLEDDPARILRGYRLTAQCGLWPNDATRQAWRELAPAMIQAAPERLHEELLRWFGIPEALPSILWGAEDGALFELFPPLRDAVGVDQNGFHHLDVWEHTLEALRELERLRRDLPPPLQRWEAELRAAWDAPVSQVASAGALTRLALLLHDTGKPATREVQPDGHATFYHHQEEGVRLMLPLLFDLKFAVAETDFLALLVREHLRLGFYSDHDPVPPRLVYRFINRLGEATPLMLLHSLADCAATRGPENTGKYEQHVYAAAVILGHYYAADHVAAPPVLLDGHAIMRLLGLKPGREVGRLKEALLEATAAGEVRDVSQAEVFVWELHRHLQREAASD